MHFAVSAWRGSSWCFVGVIEVTPPLPAAVMVGEEEDLGTVKMTMITNCNAMDVEQVETELPTWQQGCAHFIASNTFSKCHNCFDKAGACHLIRYAARNPESRFAIMVPSRTCDDL